MSSFTHSQKSYPVDDQGFLIDFMTWDEGFAEGMAARLKIPHGLTKEHWDVIHYIRNTFARAGRCPLLYETCRMNGLLIRELKNLFPTGYLRGACKIAGISYREGSIEMSKLPLTADDLNIISIKKTYTVDVRGFLVDPDQWDEYYAAHRAYDMKIPGANLTEEHWQIIKYLRSSYAATGTVPTVYEVCEACRVDLDELQRLFPDGYHRGAVKIAGLRVR